MDHATAATAALIEQVLAKPSAEVRAVITPDIAARLLATVDLDVSRRLVGHNIHRLALAMRDGTFQEIESGYDLPNPMTITARGNLRNGKQRLVALIMTGTTHTFLFQMHTTIPEEH